MTDGFLPRGELYVNTEEDISAAIYARTSSYNQQFGQSLDEQVRQCIERCQMLNWKPIFVFRDSVESGKDTDRPEFQSMMDKAEQGNFDVILFWALDRFSRSLHHAVRLEAELREMDVALHSITEQIDTTTPSGRFNFQSIASAAEFEREHIKQRSQMGQRALALQGKWPNDSPPLGYNMKKDQKLAVNDNEGRLVKRIFDRYIDLKSMPAVAAELNKDGIPTKGGMEWTGRKIRGILTNQLYIGNYSVAGVENDIPEYQIIEKDRFREATEVRTRFQREGKQSRPTMEKMQKRKLIKSVIEQYDEYHCK